MRSEKRNRFLAVLMALVLLATVPAVYLRVQIAGGKLTPGDLEKLVDYNSAYTDCTGDVIMDNENPVPDVLGNLFGFDGYIANALSAVYNDREGAASFNRLTGIRSLREREGCRLETTLLPVGSQQALADAFQDQAGNSYNGSVFAYNYKTGQVYTALSLPSVGHYQEGLPDGSLYNKVLRGTYTPGSTMKVVALLCALEQTGIDPDTFTFDCDGVTEAPDGNRIVCSYPHGKGLTLKDAIGLSCNGYITELAGQFNVEEACASLQRMGFSTQLQQMPPQYMGALSRSSSSTVFADPAAFADRWAFAGQGATVVSCVDMAMIAGAIVNGGQAAEPYLLQQVVDLDTGNVSEEAKTNQRRLFSETTAAGADSYWSDACEQYYSLSCDAISHAKTGTAQFDNGTTSRSLLGVMEQYNTAFFIYVEGLRSGDDRCVQIAGVLADELSKLN